MVATPVSSRLSLSAIYYEQQRLVEKTRPNQRTHSLTHSQFKESRLKSIDRLLELIRKLSCQEGGKHY